MLIDSVTAMAALAPLTPNQREALVDTVVLGHTQLAVGQRMGVTHSRVQQLVQAAHLRIDRDPLLARERRLADAA